VNSKEEKTPRKRGVGELRKERDTKIKKRTENAIPKIPEVLKRREKNRKRERQALK